VYAFDHKAEVNTCNKLWKLAH